MVQLDDGYFDVPAGKIAAVVTSLEMTARPPHRPDPPSSVLWRLVRVAEPQPVAYRRLFRDVGSEWLWFSRLKLADAALQAIIAADGVEIYHLAAGAEEAGLLELDFRESGTCELSFFGVVPLLIGTGAGRWLMNRALDIVWSREISRFWVHSCTLDHPAALDFYRRSGFRPFRRQIEIADDPRLSGLIAPEEAAHLPIL
jgi:GNAT superfamily N-acetyltransferase